MNEEVVAAEVTETIETAEKVVENSESFSDVTHHAADVAVEKTNEFVNYMKSLITWGHLFRLIGAIIILLILWVIYKCVRKALKKMKDLRFHILFAYLFLFRVASLSAPFLIFSTFSTLFPFGFLSKKQTPAKCESLLMV